MPKAFLAYRQIKQNQKAMRLIVIRTLLLFFLAFHCQLMCLAQTNHEKCNTVERLISALEELHYSPIQYNDSISAAIFTRFLNELDPYHLYFTSADRDILYLAKYKLDDEIKAGSCEFLNKTLERYKNGLIRAKKVITKLQTQAFKLQQNDTLEYIPDYNLEEVAEGYLQKRWRKWLKHKTITRLFSPSVKHPKPYLRPTEELLALEPNIRKAVCAKELKIIDEKLQDLSESNNFVNNSFFNAIAHQYDPHTDYFSVSEKQFFESLLEDQALSFGFDFAENKEGDLEITTITPGGPAWKSNELHKGDILQRLSIGNDNEYDLTLITENRFEKILQPIDKTPVVLTVRKVSGQLKSVTLVKEVIRNDENAINSFILSGTKKVGYIALPSFYTETENANMLGCANDFAKELIGLKREDIEGLVIDLRNNGGGSVKEAIELAGIFIDAGPLFVASDNEGNLTTIKDPNRGTIYDGPVIILMNKLSASASEVFASTLQDYNRALIIGTASYGKSTGQLILPLLNKDDYKRLSFWDMDAGFGFVKVTTSKFYRIAGNTHQLNGVQPDIYLPEILEGFQLGEYTYPTALAADSIIKKLYYTLLPEIPISQLKVKSQQRLASHQNFKEINTAKDLVGEVWGLGESTLYIGLEPYRKYQKKLFELSERWENLSERTINNYKVQLSNYDKENISVDPQIEAIYDIRKKKISRDIYVEEAFNVLMDMINLN